MSGCRMAFHDLDRNDIASRHAEPFGEALDEGNAFGRRVDGAQCEVSRAPQLAALRQSYDRSEVGPLRGTQTHRHNPLPLDRDDAALMREVPQDRPVDGLRKGEHGVAAFDQIELDIHHPVDGIAPEQAEHDHGHGEREAENGQRRMERGALRYGAGSTRREEGLRPSSDESSAAQRAAWRQRAAALRRLEGRSGLRAMPRPS